MFDYVLTGPISAVSAGLYLGGLMNELGEYFHHPGVRVHPPFFAAVFEDVQLLHELWLDLSAMGFGAKLHHRDVVGVALRRLRQQLNSDAGDAVVGDVALEIKHTETGGTV